MVLRIGLESFPSHELLRTAVVQCQVEIIGTRQVTACFKVHFPNSLARQIPRKKTKTPRTTRFLCYLTYFHPQYSFWCGA